MNEETIKQLCINGLVTDGEHHKQWYFEEILKILGVDLEKLFDDLLNAGYEPARGIST